MKKNSVLQKYLVSRKSEVEKKIEVHYGWTLSFRVFRVKNMPWKQFFQRLCLNWVTFSLTGVCSKGWQECSNHHRRHQYASQRGIGCCVMSSGVNWVTKVILHAYIKHFLVIVRTLESVYKVGSYLLVIFLVSSTRRICVCSSSLCCVMADCLWWSEVLLLYILWILWIKCVTDM